MTVRCVEAPRRSVAVPVWVCALLMGLVLPVSGGEAGGSSLDLEPLRQWFSKQTDVRAISAEFVQTRSLRALKSPIASPGRFWLKASDGFRWELGTPPKTIVIGTPNGLTIIYPDRREAQRWAANAFGGMPDSVAWGILCVPGKTGFDEFLRRIRILDVHAENGICRVEMLPRDLAAAKALSVVKLDFDQASGFWLRLEIVAKDGSSICNEFHNIQRNPSVNKRLMEYDLTGFKVRDEGP